MNMYFLSTNPTWTQQTPQQKGSKQRILGMSAITPKHQKEHVWSARHN